MPDFILEETGRIKRLSVSGFDLSIGRDEENDLVIGNENISRNHARLQRLPEGWVLEDLGSANGIKVDGTRIARAVLDRGSVILLGDVSLTFLGGGDEDNPLSGAPQIDGYTVKRYAGEGPLTVDYAFTRDSDGKEFTVRHVRDVWAEDESYMASLVESASELQSVTIEGLVPFEFRKDTNGAPYLIEEPLSGCPRREDGRALRMSEVEALRITSGVARILNELHAHDIRHHGLHPGRVGLTEDGEILLGALGFPRGVATRSPDASVRSLSCLAPEGFSPEGVLGLRSDVYAVGALLHELLLGAPVAEGNTIAGCTRSVLKGIQRSPDDRRRGLSPGVSDLVMDCTSLDPADRISEMGEVVSRLAASTALSQARLNTSADAAPIVQGESGRPPRSKMSKWVSWGITLLIFALAQLLVVLFFYR